MNKYTTTKTNTTKLGEIHNLTKRAKIVITMILHKKFFLRLILSMKASLKIISKEIKTRIIKITTTLILQQLEVTTI